MIREIRLIVPGGHFRCKRWRLGLFSFYTHSQKRRYSGLAIHLYGLLAWAAAALLACYLFAVTCLFLVWRREPYLQVGYREMLLLPGHWRSLQTRRAQASIAAGLQAMRQSRWEEGEIRIRQGLQAAPELLDGRLQLAHFYLTTGRWPVAAQLLSGALERAFPGRDFLAGAFAAALAVDDFQQCGDWAMLILSRHRRSMRAEDRRWVLEQAGQFLAAGLRYDEVLALAAQYPADIGPEFRQAEILALLARKDFSRALARIEDWQRADSGPSSARDCLRAIALRRCGRIAEMEIQLDELCSRFPDNCEVLIFAAAQRFDAGRLPAADLTLRVLLSRFGGGAPALEAAMRGMAEAGYGEGMDDIFSFARQNGRVTKQLLLSEAVYRLSTRDFPAAHPYFVELDQAWNLSNPRERALEQFYELLYAAAADPAERAQKRLADYCEKEMLEWRDLAGAAEALAKAGRKTSALALLDVGLERDPSSYHLSELKRSIRATGADAPPTSVR